MGVWQRFARSSAIRKVMMRIGLGSLVRRAAYWLLMSPPLEVLAYEVEVGDVLKVSSGLAGIFFKRVPFFTQHKKKAGYHNPNSSKVGSASS